MSMSVKPPAASSLLSLIKIPSITAFSFRFRNIHAFTWTRSRSLDFPDQHPLAPVVLKRYALREELPLWWHCIARREVGETDRVVRSWLARRTRNAVKESLNKKGYDTNGRPLPGSGNRANLFGTAVFAVKRESTSHPFVDLVKETDIAVAYIQRLQDRPNNGQKEWLRIDSRNKERGRGRGSRSTSRWIGNS